MKEILQQIIQSQNTHEQKIHALREYLQILILKILADQKAYENMVFLGGTALRILYHLQRYSEDLDFSLYKKQNYDFLKLIKNLKKSLENYHLNVELKYKEGIIDSCFINFIGLLSELELSEHTSQKLSVKLEIDTNPPTGAAFETSLMNEHYIFPVKHHDLPSLMAGKLHAILCRGFDKGRDWYDLLWYLSKNIQPNLTLLQNAFDQNKEHDSYKSSQWIILLETKIKNTDFEVIKKDVRPFLLNKEELTLFQSEYFEKTLTEY